MVDLDALARRARRRAEWGRARMACRIAAAIAPLAVVSAAAGADPGVCACAAVLLFVTSALLRWRSQLGVDSAHDGLLLGTLPLGAALLLGDCDVECYNASVLSGPMLACSIAGALVGIGVTLRAVRVRRHRTLRWVLTLLVAAMTAALGCAGLGLGGVVSVLIALGAVAGTSWIPVSLRAP